MPRQRYRAVTAEDYEALALDASPEPAASRGATSARPTTPRDRPSEGHVSVILVPRATAEDGDGVGARRMPQPEAGGDRLPRAAPAAHGARPRGRAGLRAGRGRAPARAPAGRGTRRRGPPAGGLRGLPRTRPAGPRPGLAVRPRGPGFRPLPGAQGDGGRRLPDRRPARQRTSGRRPAERGRGGPPRAERRRR